MQSIRDVKKALTSVRSASCDKKDLGCGYSSDCNTLPDTVVVWSSMSRNISKVTPMSITEPLAVIDDSPICNLVFLGIWQYMTKTDKWYLFYHHSALADFGSSIAWCQQCRVPNSPMMMELLIHCQHQVTNTTLKWELVFP